MIIPGRVGSNLKIQKALGNMPYATIFSVVGQGEIGSTDWSVLSGSTAIQGLPYYNLHSSGSTAKTVYLASESTNDIVGGTGAQNAILTGLNNDYEKTQELLALNGTTPVASVNNYVSQTENLIFSYGSLTDPVTGDSKSDGNIWTGVGTFTGGIPQYPLTFIDSASIDGNSRDLLYSCPANKRVVVHGFTISTEKDVLSDSDCDVQLAIRFFGFGDNHWFKTPVYRMNGIFKNEFLTYIPLPPKCEIVGRVRVKNIKAKEISVELTVEEVDLT